MMTHDGPVVEPGTLLRVLETDELHHIIYGRLQNGKAAQVTGLQAPLPEPGELILVGENFWNTVPESVWMSVNAVSVVRTILDDDTVLIDDGLSIRLVSNPDDLPLAVGNTVEFSDAEGIIRVLSDSPIRSRDAEIEPADILQDYLVNKSDSGPKFEDFGGYPDVIGRARELIETQFLHREYLDEIGARPIKGVLFTGPPGTGKTYLARIIANESDADFFLVSGPAIVSKWVGDTEGTLRRLFDAATQSKSGRAIIFFDEIDSIAERRSGDTHEASRRLVAQLLTLMDGFDDKGKSVVVIAATNRVESLDPALTRPGRFDWEIEFGSPTADDRSQILEAGAATLKTCGLLPIHDIAHLTDGWSAAELTSIWTEAALVAAADSRACISPEDLALAYERVARRPRRRIDTGDSV